ncbi:flagellar hook assembly protein FlgD [Anaerobacillus alkaliphilus]|uniref:Flagellar hook assembly protein FlgD n=1 Tax=Anaerobacillus alkaliphilus TaxID=1548597 RepID=A0A4Q0VNT6_9BACI|nr:flagellar hook assembly protein FlgD [Anaerobacillus alkaliphilus]RXI98003.1 flagellar hook assembly protein FlgD [Anaerobacillus alkaliphilus]
MINSVNSLYLSDRQVERKTGQNTLDQDAFLKILLTQLANQDPSKPMEDKEFISQMANFSSLEQMTQMNKALTGFIEMQKDSHFLSHSQLIGKEIQWEQVVANPNGETDLRLNDSVVKAIKFQHGKTRLVLEGGQVIDTIQVVHISRPTDKE